jgi:superoxide dismutase
MAARGTPASLLVESIGRDFGNLKSLEAQFDDAGEKLLGSGWGWLMRTRQNRAKLAVISTGTFRVSRTSATK